MSAKSPTTRAQHIAAAIAHIDTASRLLAHPRGHHCETDNLRAAADALAILRCLTGQKPDLAHTSCNLQQPARETTRISIEMEMNKAEAQALASENLLY